MEQLQTQENNASLARTSEAKVTHHKLQDKCPVCNKVAKLKNRTMAPNGVTILFYECGHCEFIQPVKSSDYSSLVFDGDVNCHHKWGIGKYRTICQICDAKKLYEYQVKGALEVERANGRFAILDDMGLGKTIQGLAYLKYNLATSLPYLWVTKSKIKYQHAKEIARVLGLNYFPYIIANSKQYIPNNSPGYMISYDLFKNLDLAIIVKLDIQTIILDECQAIKNPNSARTIALQEVVKNIPKVIPMSGTFWKNRGSEAFVMLNMLDPKMFWNFTQFKRDWVRYVIDPETGKEKEGGFKNPELFRKKIAHIAIRRERKEVMPELPSVNRTKLFCEVPEHARLAYNEQVKKIQAIVKDSLIDGTEGSFEVQSKLQASIIIMRQIVGLAKVPAIIEYLEEFLEDTDRKIVCFVHHIEVGRIIFKELANWCSENNIEQPIQMLGGTSAEDSGKIQDIFNDSPCRLLIASTLAAGEGLNLQKNCYDMIMAERQWNPANEEQAEARFIRIGQNSDSVNAVYALGDKTVDTILDNIVHFKRVEFHNAMNKTELTQWNESSIFKAMIDSIVKDKL